VSGREGKWVKGSRNREMHKKNKNKKFPSYNPFPLPPLN
jgi:hypothetical protein